jgi:cation diffusion facilitator family transporter
MSAYHRNGPFAMHSHQLRQWQHEHVFGQDLKKSGENRTLVVIIITAIMMVIELFAGVIFGSMALLADGLHMASHAVALSISAFAYIYARRHARNPRFSFGTGKVNALGGFTGAILLALFACYMAVESLWRLANPVEIVFNQAIAVAVLGLIVNGVSVWILGADNHEHHDHNDHHPEYHHHQEHDHNLKSAYLHVLADALTSILAIAALLSGKYFGLVWMDPLMGIVGAVLVSRWSWGLLRETSATLLDQQAPSGIRDTIRHHLERDGDTRITDLHVWSIGPGLYSAIVSVVAHQPETPENYKARIPEHLSLAHLTIEVQHCTNHT